MIVSRFVQVCTVASGLIDPSAYLRVIGLSRCSSRRAWHCTYSQSMKLSWAPESRRAVTVIGVNVLSECICIGRKINEFEVVLGISMVLRELLREGGASIVTAG
jgi:hypothetical protein